jgi:tetratricopeptide (TPR) repeat protein
MKRGIVFFGILVFLLLFGGWALSNDSLEEGKKTLAEGLQTFQKSTLLKARNIFEEILKTKPDYPKIHYYLAQSIDGLAYAEEFEGNKDGAYGLIEEGVKAAKRSVELDDSYSDGHRTLATFYGRIIAIKGGMTGAMYGSLNEEEIQRALQLDSENAKAHLELGISRANTPPQFGGDLDVGIKEMEEAIRIDPKLDMAYYHLGRALTKKGEKDRGKEVLRKGLGINPSNGFIKRELDKM